MIVIKVVIVCNIVTFIGNIGIVVQVSSSQGFHLITVFNIAYKSNDNVYKQKYTFLCLNVLYLTITVGRYLNK